MSRQEFPTGEARRIDNVAYRATNSPIFPPLFDECEYIPPQLFHSVPRGTLFGFLTFCCVLCLGTARIRYGPRLQSALRTSPTLQAETIRGAPIANLLGLCSTWNAIWVSELRCVLCLGACQDSLWA